MEIAHGHINVTLSDQEAIAGLRRVDKEFDRTMDKIDRKEAEASVGADLAKLRRDLKTAEALVKEWENKVANARTRGQKRYRTAQLEAAQADAKHLRGAIQQEADRLAQLKAQNKQRDLANAKERELERAARRQVKEQERLLKAKDRSLETARKETLEAAKLQQKYSKLQQQLQKLDHSAHQFMRRFDRPLQTRLRIETRGVKAEIEDTRRRLIELGDTPIEIPRDVDRGRLAKWLGDLTQMTVRIGPFTTTIAQLGRAMLLLGPIISGLLGTLGALTSAVGAGLVGAVGAASAGMFGFALAAGGIFAIAKPLVGELTNMKKASEAYDKAVREHGEGSDQAAKKLKVLHSVMGHVDDRTVEQFKSLGSLGDRWRKLTSAARPEFFRVVGEGIETINTLMPMFAKNSVNAFKAVGAGLTDWMKGLRSAEGQRIIDNIGDRFNQAIPSIMSGLGNLGTAMGRVFESFSRHFTSLGRGFEAWTQGIADATGRSGQLNGRVDKLVSAMRSLGRFAAATGRVLFQFFRGAFGPGVGALDSMTNSFNKLAASMGTVQGQRGLNEFFRNSIETTGKFLAALKPIAEVFFEFTTIMRPFTDAALVGVAAVGKLVQVLADLAPTRIIVQGLVAIWTAWSVAKILGIAGAIGRVAAAMKALAVGQGAVGALSALFAAGGAAGAAGRGGAIAGSIEKVVAAAAGGSAAAKVLTGLGRAFLRIAGPAGLAASAALIWGGNAETAATKANKLTDASRGLSSEITASSRSLSGSYTNIANNSLTLADANKNVSTALKEVNRLQADGKTNTQAYRDAIGELNFALEARTSAEKQIAGSQQNLTRAQNDVAKAGFAVTDAQKGYTTAIMDVENHVDKLDGSYQGLIQQYGSLENAPLGAIESLKALQGHEDDLANTLNAARGAHTQLAAAERQHKQVLDLAALGTVNYSRAVQGLHPIAATAAASIRRLQSALGTKKVAQISLKFPDPREAERVMRAIDRAIQGGVGKKRAFNLVINSKSAEQAVARTKAALAGLSNKEIRIIEKGGDDAIKTIQRIAGRKLTPKELRIAERGGPAALAMIARIEAKQIRQKEVRVVLQGLGATISGIGQIIGGLNRIPSLKTTTHLLIQRKAGSLGRAEGGPVTPAEKAAERASRRATQSVTGGGVFRQPTFLVGEEDRSEIVIATNPAYRRRNLGFLGMAARALGANATLPDGTILAADGFARDNTYYAPANLPSAPAPSRRPGKTPRSPKKRRQRQGRVYRSQNAWSSYIANLKSQQDDWEREVGIRTAAVQEPDDFIIEVGRTKTVTDPESGETFGNEPIYGVDEEAVAQFQAQLREVKAAYDRLVAITQAIVEAVPKAIAANKAELAVRRENRAALKRVIAQDTRRSRRKGKPGERAQRRVNINEERLQREDAAIEALRADNEQLPQDRKEAGFDIREFLIEARDTQIEIDAVAPGAAEAAKSASAEQPKQPTASGGSGGGSGGTGGSTAPTGPSPMEQRATLSSERGRILSEFGGNAIPRPFAGAGAVGRAARAPGGAFTGFGQNVASRNGSFGAGAAFVPRGGGGGFAPSGGAGGGGGGDTIVTVNNSFSEPPPDAHTWSQGVGWELQAAV